VYACKIIAYANKVVGHTIFTKSYLGYVIERLRNAALMEVLVWRILHSDLLFLHALFNRKKPFLLQLFIHRKPLICTSCVFNFMMLPSFLPT